MKRTPDPKTAKRGRSEETITTPAPRQRTSSPDQDYGTPVWKENQSENNVSSTLNRSHLDNIENGEIEDNFNWSNHMEEEEVTQNLSNVSKHFQELGANDGRTKGTEISENDSRTDGTEMVGDQSINRMIDETINQRDLCKEGLLPGVSQLLTAIRNQPQDQLINLIKLTIEQAVNEAINPLKEELKEIRKMMNEAKNQTHPSPSLSTTPIWPTLRTTGAIPKTRTDDKSEMEERAINLANRCVGLGPIPPSKVKQHIEATNPALDIFARTQLGGAFAIRDFLCTEMGLTDNEADNVRIVRTFRTNENDYNLFAEFGDESCLKRIRSKVGNLSKGGEENPKLTPYVPQHLKSQYLQLVARANRGRAQSPKQSSKIWLGKKEFELRFRQKGDFTPWNKIQPVNEPEQIVFKIRMSLIDERANRKQETPKSTPSSSTVSNVQCNNNSNSNRNNQPSFNNPNLIPISGSRPKGNILGKRLIPRGITTANRFEHLQDQVSSP